MRGNVLGEWGTLINIKWLRLATLDLALLTFNQRVFAVAVTVTWDLRRVLSVALVLV